MSGYKEYDIIRGYRADDSVERSREYWAGWLLAYYHFHRL